jgi:hypothetical protein
MRKFWYIPAAALVAVAVAVFLGGWLQLSLGRDVWGVIFTPSHGFESSPVDPSRFSWRWERIVPRLLTLYKVPVTTQRADFDVDVVLPSGDAYASLMRENPDFSVQMRVSVLYRLKPDRLSSLVEHDGLRLSTVGDWHRQLQAGLEQGAAEIALQLGNSPREGADIGALSSALSGSLAGRFPAVQIISVTTTVRHLPDADLYARLKSSYLRIADLKGAALAALAPRLAAEEAAEKTALARHESSMTLLTRYGELLDKYPSLIKLLFLASAGKLSPRDLQSLDILDKLPALE